MDALNLAFKPNVVGSGNISAGNRSTYGGGSAWNDERHNYMVELLGQGLSAGKAAAEINGKYGTSFSRCAIIGRAQRNGVLFANGGRPSGAQRRPRRSKGETIQNNYIKNRIISAATRRRNPTPKKQSKPTIAYGNYIPKLDLEIPVEQRKALVELERGQCRWPVGDPLEEGFFFCGGEAVPGLPYCACHARGAYRPAPRRAA